MSTEFSKSRVLSPNKRHCVFIYDFGCLYDDIHAKAFVLPHAIESKNIFLVPKVSFTLVQMVFCIFKMKPCNLGLT